MEQTFDPGTIRIIEALGIGEGWRCLEVGAGAGSVARWLSTRVGSTGQVVATDIDVRYLSALAGPNLSVLQHNIVSSPVTADTFDLVHARLLLDLLVERSVALDHLVAALRPGGWLVVEEFDSVTSVPDPAPGIDVGLFMKMQQAMRQLWELRGFDAEYGRKLRRELAARGLEAIGAEGRVFMRQGGPLGGRSYRLSFEHLKSDYIRHGFITDDEAALHLNQLDDLSLSYMSPLLMATWGRKPI